MGGLSGGHLMDTFIVSITATRGLHKAHRKLSRVVSGANETGPDGYLSSAVSYGLRQIYPWTLVQSHWIYLPGLPGNRRSVKQETARRL